MAEKKVAINFDQLRQAGYRGAKRAAAFVALGQKVWSDETLTSVAMGGPFKIQLLPEPLPKNLADETREAFRHWISGSAIAEIVQSLCLFTDDYYRIAVLLTFHGKKVSAEALQRIETFCDLTSLHSKLKRIKQECDLESPLLKHSDGWVRARNAHAHSHGVVSPRQLGKQDNLLTVTWRKPEFLIDGKAIKVGHYVEKDSLLQYHFGDAAKSFGLGDRIDFTEQEILEIGLTVEVLTTATVEQLHKRAVEIAG